MKITKIEENVYELVRQDGESVVMEETAAQIYSMGKTLKETRMDDDGEGHWITTKNGHHVQIGEGGEILAGNPHVVAKMEGKGGSKGVSSKVETALKNPSKYVKNAMKNIDEETIDEMVVLADRYLHEGTKESDVKELLAEHYMENEDEDMFGSFDFESKEYKDLREKLGNEIYSALKDKEEDYKEQESLKRQSKNEINKSLKPRK